MTVNTELARDLRAVADFLDDHPELRPQLVGSVLCHVSTRDEMAAARDMLASVSPVAWRQVGTSLFADGDIGGIGVHVGGDALTLRPEPVLAESRLAGWSWSPALDAWSAVAP